MSNEKTGGAAFPINTQQMCSDGSTVIRIEDGMTLLDFFAAKALPYCQSRIDAKNSAENAAHYAYRQAAAMLAERKKYITE